MIKETKIEITISHRNIKHYLDKYDFDELNIKYMINVDVNKNSKERVTAIYEICESENPISIQKYYKNKDRGYHFNKSRTALKNGIKLIHIWRMCVIMKTKKKNQRNNKI